MQASNEVRKPLCILIAEDHPITREGLIRLINHQPDLVVSGEAQNAAQALDLLCSSAPDLVLTDLSLPDKSGVDLIKAIAEIRPGLPVLVLSMHEESLYAEPVLLAGGRGYLPKHAGGEKILQAIRHVLSGNLYFNGESLPRCAKSC